MKTRNTSIIRKISQAALLGLPLAIAAGCSVFPALFPVANQHPANWVDDHGKKVQAMGGPEKATVDNGMSCNVCHTSTQGADKTIAASKGATNTCYTCHAGGPSGNPHLTGWKAEHGAFTTKAGGYKVALVNGKSCNICHTTEKAADGSIPPSPVGSTTCFKCHEGPDPNAPQPVASTDPNAPKTRTWSTDVQPVLGHASCNTCHVAEGIGTIDSTNYYSVKGKKTVMLGMLNKSTSFLTPQQIQNVKDWYNAGTPDDETTF